MINDMINGLPFQRRQKIPAIKRSVKGKCNVQKAKRCVGTGQWDPGQTHEGAIA